MATLPDGGTVTSQHVEYWETVLSTTTQSSESWESGSFASSSIGLIREMISETFDAISKVVGSVDISLSSQKTTQGGDVEVYGTATDENGDPAAGFTYRVIVEYSSGQVYKEKSGTVDSSGEFSERIKFENEGDYNIYSTISGTTGVITSESWESGSLASSSVGTSAERQSEPWSTIEGISGTITAESWESGTLASSTIGTVKELISEGWES